MSHPIPTSPCKRWLATTLAGGLIAGLLSVSPAQAAATTTDGPTLAGVRAAGKLSCGVVEEEAEYNKVDQHGGLDALGGEVCKAIAAAVLGDATKVNIVQYPVEMPALEGLQKKAVDVVVGVTPTETAAWHYGVSFGPPVFYDALGVMVHRESGIAKLTDLAGRSVCTIDDTESQRVLQTEMQARHIADVLYPFEEEGELEAALVVGHCDAMSADLSKLADARTGFHAEAQNFVFLPETLTIDPVAPAYRYGDQQWHLIVDGVVNALVQAEASGVTQANVASMKNSQDITVQRLIGVDFASARALGLDHQWAARMIAAVGNYGEIYRRTTGMDSPLAIPRGMNALWTQGGLMRPLPMR